MARRGDSRVDFYYNRRCAVAAVAVAAAAVCKNTNTRCFRITTFLKNTQSWPESSRKWSCATRATVIRACASMP